MNIQLTQIKTYCIIASLSVLATALKAQSGYFTNLVVANGTLLMVSGSPSSPNPSPALQVQYPGASYSMFSVRSLTGFYGDGGFGETVELDTPDVNHYIQATSGGNMIVASSDPLFLQCGTPSYPSGQVYLGDGLGYANSTYVKVDDSAQHVTISSATGITADGGSINTDGGGNVLVTGLGTTGNNTTPPSSLIIPFAPAASPFGWTNTTAQNMVVYVDGIQGSVSYNGTPIYRFINRTQTFVMMQPGAFISIVNNLPATNTVRLSWHQF